MTAKRITAVFRLAFVMFALAGIALSFVASAMSTADFLAALSEGDANAFQDWKAARRTYEGQLDSYWEKVDEKRQARKKKRAA